MDHSESIRLMAAEKYLLGELAPEVREQFEEHFFGCQECALDVRLAAALVGHSKVLLADSPAQPFSGIAARNPAKPAGWLRPALLIPALAILLAVIGYQNLVTYPRLKGAVAIVDTPGILPSASLISVNSRGGSKPVVIVRRGEPFLLYVDIPTEARFAAYQAELYGPAGSREWTLAIPAEKAKDTLPIRVPPARQAPGQYTLIVSGVTAAGEKNSEIGHYPFELQIVD